MFQSLISTTIDFIFNTFELVFANLKAKGTVVDEFSDNIEELPDEVF